MEDTKVSKMRCKFKIKLGQVFSDNNRNIIITDTAYKKLNGVGISQKCYKIKCNVCGWAEGWMSEYSLLRGRGCRCCSNQIVVAGINSIYDTEKWMIPYIGTEASKLYTHCSNKIVNVKCNNCNRISKMNIHNLYKRKKVSCICNDSISYPNKIMYSVLSQLSIPFKNEKSFNWCKYYFRNKIRNGIYDFYFEYKNVKYIIEMDGQFHHINNKLNGYTREDSKFIDEEKDKLAAENKIHMIRINSDASNIEYIKENILKSKLKEIFININDINWNKCEEFALSSVVREVCVLKRDNPDITTSEIASVSGLHKSCVIKYLNKGNKIWDWVNYNPQVESQKSIINNQKTNSKNVEIFKNNKSCGVFKGCHTIERISEKQFGIRLLSSNIACVCRGLRKSYKGFTFKYIGD